MTHRHSLMSLSLLLAAAAAAVATGPDKTDPALESSLRQSFELGKKRSPGTRYFDMASTFTTIAANGARGPSETYRMKLKCVSPVDAAKTGDQYTCLGFVYVNAAGREGRIPALDNWTYTFKMTDTGYDEEGRVFKRRIDQFSMKQRFQNESSIEGES